MRARQQVTFQLRSKLDVQHLSIGGNITDGSFILSLTAPLQSSRPATLYSRPIAWNDTAGAIQQALGQLQQDISVSKVG